MAFWNEQEMQAAMTWFNEHQTEQLPAPELLGIFTDDHIICANIKFGDLFNYTFWYAGAEGLWSLARNDISYIKEQIANDLEDVERDGEYTFESMQDNEGKMDYNRQPTKLPHDLQLLCNDFYGRYKYEG
jgi:hypothetical protein